MSGKFPGNLDDWLEADSRQGSTILRPHSELASVSLLACGHPGAPENLIEGKCGTCQLADEFENLSKHEDKKLAEACGKIAEMFRSGKAVYDRKAGKNLLEWEAFFKPVNPKANEKS